MEGRNPFFETNFASFGIISAFVDRLTLTLSLIKKKAFFVKKEKKIHFSFFCRWLAGKLKG